MRAISLVLPVGLGIAPGIALGCSFFKELESLPGADTEAGSTGTNESGGSENEQQSGDGSGSESGGPCTLANDDYCLDQDTVHACRLDDGETVVASCTDMCGQYLNVTCIDVGTGQHGCWCVQPGKHNVYGCTALESCVAGCAGVIECIDPCFSRATQSTIRLFGTLMFCGRDTCADACNNLPSSCQACIANALAGIGGCELERTVCDNDESDEPDPDPDPGLGPH